MTSIPMFLQQTNESHTQSHNLLEGYRLILTNNSKKSNSAERWHPEEEKVVTPLSVLMKVQILLRFSCFPNLGS